ncbi:MAG: methylmalonyl Co-A mutase-associated GTPase MeaB [Persicimonas sp.]
MSESLADRILNGDVRAAGRLMRRVDDQHPDARTDLEALFEHTGDAYLIGITGNPGSGKSTLVNKFIALCRERGATVGVVAVDPTSPFSGGAILGDRIRMQEHALDDGVFIRSVATRGNLGGLSRSTPALVQILDAMGFDFILIETVGVGQDEVDIARVADTNVVVTVPGMGDDIQATKAGLMEIADIFVINKSDKEGSDRLRRELKTMLSLDETRTDDDWTPPVIHTVATQGEGLETLFEQIEEHRKWLEDHQSEGLRDRRRLEHLVKLIVSGELDARLARALTTEEWHATLKRLADRKESPYAVAEAMIEKLATPG